MSGYRRFWKIEFALVVCLALISYSSHAWTQIRWVGKVEPNPEGTTDPLVFDVNIQTGDNISPNIVLSQDGTRGFVAYAGSGEVMEFSLATGEVLNRIDTGGKPAFATCLPDKRTLLIVSVLDNRIFAVDMDSNPSRQVATFTFADAQFGFGSIIELSPDGKVGYISSTGTGEVIKFATGDGLEIGRFRGMRYPAQITATPDGETIIIVDTDIGTPELLFVDTTTLSKKGSLKNPDPTTMVVVFSIFNKPVLAPDGKTGIMASRGQNSVLYKELVFLFDATNGTILDTGETGAGPGFTGITPDGKNWVILNMFSVTVIPTDNFDGLQEFNGASGDPLGSANIAISPDSRFGYYAASAYDLIFQMELSTGAVLDQLLVGDNPNVYLDQASSMAVSPDGNTIIALEFISNNLELMTPTTRVAAVKFLCSPDMYTGLSLINLSTKRSELTLFAMQDFGELNQEEGVVNPVRLTMEPNEQFSTTVSELFNFDDNNAPNGERTGWIAIYSTEPEITGYLAIGKKDLTSLNGLPLESKRAKEFILPEMDRLGDQTMEISRLNDTYYYVDYETQRVAKDGTVIDKLSNQSVMGNSRLSQYLPDLFPRTDVEKEGYLFMYAPAGLMPAEFYFNGVSAEAIRGLDLDKFVGIRKVYAPHFATVPGWITRLNLINASLEEADVTLTLHGADGAVLGQPVERHFKSGEQLKDDLTNIFTSPEALNATGWLEIESTQDQIVGIITFAADDNRFTASFELNGTPLDRFLIPVVVQNESYETGVALLNPHGEEAQIQLEIWGLAGNVINRTTLKLGPMSHTAVYMNTLFPNMDPLLLGNLRIRSDKSLYGFSLMNDSGFKFLMPMPAIPFF
ncbi:MAG: 6-phosphogluconolactonase [Acidobacteria bacterium]|nr:6-phosphogluconolactonase [Acidobacteriota bacterium]